MGWISDHPLFRSLTDAEVERFREHARKNDPDPAKWDLYHPVVREEWMRLGKMPVAEMTRDYEDMGPFDRSFEKFGRHVPETAA